MVERPHRAHPAAAPPQLCNPAKMFSSCRGCASCEDLVDLDALPSRRHALGEREQQVNHPLVLARGDEIDERGAPLTRAMSAVSITSVS